MAISIPTILDTLLTNLRAELEPVVTAATNTASMPRAPYVNANRVADLINELVGLIDSGTLTATTGSETDGFTDSGAFTGVNSLVGATFTYAAATTTVALRGVVRTVQSNTVNKVVFSEATVANQVGDTGTLEFTTVDTNITALRQGKSTGDSASNPYGPGPQLIDAGIKLLTQLGATVPDYLTGAVGIANAEPFGLGSPHGGGNANYGHGGAILMGDLAQRVRDAVAGYTAPA
jgi:hypothetical protein